MTTGLDSTTRGLSSLLTKLLNEAERPSSSHGSHSIGGGMGSSGMGSTGMGSARSTHTHRHHQSGMAASTGITSAMGSNLGSTGSAASHASGNSSLSLPQGSDCSGSSSSGSSSSSGGSSMEAEIQELAQLLQPLLQQLLGGSSSGSSSGDSSTGAGAGTGAVSGAGGGCDPTSGINGTTGDAAAGMSATTAGAAAGMSSTTGATSTTGDAASGMSATTGATGTTAGAAQGTTSNLPSNQALFPTQTTSQLPGPTNVDAASSVSSTAHSIHTNDYGNALSGNKQEMQAALDPMHASASERSFLTAIAMNESTTMGGNSDPNCFSIYNMNTDMIKQVTQKYGMNITPQELNLPENQGKAAQVALLALRDYGAKGFLAFERGGPTAYQQLQQGQAINVPGANANWIDSYYSTFQARFQAIQKDPSLLTDSRRVETDAG